MESQVPERVGKQASRPPFGGLDACYVCLRWAREDSNLHSLRNQLLRLARLPITPLARMGTIAEMRGCSSRWSRISCSPSLARFLDPASRFFLLEKHRCGPHQRTKSRAGGTLFVGAPTWARTRDRLLKRELLYQLSYRRFMKTLHDSVRGFNTPMRICAGLCRG